MHKEFLGGVVEGFYGQPWTPSQRLSLFDNMVQWGLNTYFYSPKDDLKHRALWREPYTETELQRLAELVHQCNQRELNFFYGLSPGLDIRFSDQAEMAAVLARLEQMWEVGVRHFALLFDDLPGNMSEQDRERFPSVASAQASIANQVHDWLPERDRQSRLLFCPTPYCDRMVSWKLGGEDYLDTLGEALHAEIDVLWTGPEIISADIPVDSLTTLAARIRRQPIIWDNLHANDYDLRRVFCGPYNRNADMRHAVRGILTNPNNEYPLNYIPIRTLGQYIHDAEFDARHAFMTAASDWAEHYKTIHGHVSVENVRLLADCYYLPFANGNEGRRLLDVATRLLQHPPDQWGEAYAEFKTYRQRILQIFEQLTELIDRDLFYAWSRRIWELREELDLIHDFVTHKKDAKAFQSETHLPSTCRGGIVASLQRILKMNEDGSFTTE